MPTPPFNPLLFSAFARQPFFQGIPIHLFRPGFLPVYPSPFLNHHKFQRQGRLSNFNPQAPSGQGLLGPPPTQQTSQAKFQPTGVTPHQSRNAARRSLPDQSRAPTPFPRHMNGIALESQGRESNQKPLPDFLIDNWDPELGKKFDKKSDTPAPVPKDVNGIKLASQRPQPQEESLPDFPIGDWDPELGKKLDKKLDPNDIYHEFTRNMQVNKKPRREPPPKKIVFAHEKKPLSVDYSRQLPRADFYGCELNFKH